MQRIFLVTGGAGFIGSAVIRSLIADTSYIVVNIDKLTYAGNLESLLSISDNPRYHFVKADIADASVMAQVLSDFKPDVIMHLAAESHVDRSIKGPAEFIQTNIVGTYTLLEAAREYWSHLQTVDPLKAQNFRFHHISTDEVYGDLQGSDALFTESTAYSPSSPYSASKASSDHLVRAWHRTFDLPVLITNCSNNYGPFHFPEKLIPLVIINALAGKPLPVYGDGLQVRDWLYVEDHARALVLVAQSAKIGTTYTIGGHNEKTNIDVVKMLCELLDECMPISQNPAFRSDPRGIKSYSELITFVKDRPGHDLRYAIDASKIERELGWTPQESFESGLRKTVEWYLMNTQWWQRVLDGRYQSENKGA